MELEFESYNTPNCYRLLLLVVLELVPSSQSYLYCSNNIDSYDLNPNHHISTIIVPIIVLTIT